MEPEASDEKARVGFARRSHGPLLKLPPQEHSGRMRLAMGSSQDRPVAIPISSAARVVLHAGYVVAGIVTTLMGPILPILIGRWSLSDQRAGLFFTAQFCGSMVGVSTLGALIGRGYRYAFVCGLGQALSATNLWVAEVTKARRVAALSILNLAWGIGAVASSPVVMFAQRREAIPFLLYTIASASALTALILASMNLEPGAADGDHQQFTARRGENISMRSSVSLAALFFLYVGSENSIAGWVASLTKRMHPDSGDMWTLAPLFFWGGILSGRALVALVPFRWRERAL